MNNKILTETEAAEYNVSNKLCTHQRLHQLGKALQDESTYSAYKLVTLGEKYKHQHSYNVYYTISTNKTAWCAYVLSGSGYSFFDISDPSYTEDERDALVQEYVDMSIELLNPTTNYISNIPEIGSTEIFVAIPKLYGDTNTDVDLQYTITDSSPFDAYETINYYVFLFQLTATERTYDVMIYI